MARFNFRHGIARRQEDGAGNPTYLLPTNGGAWIDLIAIPDPTVFLIAHYDADYMLSENANVTKAWGPFTAGTDYWLYWDVDFITGELTRGFTTLQPVDDPNPPTSPQPDQHWYDMTQDVMKVWSGSSWVEKLRVFAAWYQNGATLIHQPIGSQVGRNGVVTYAGAILFDPDGNPVQKFQRNRRGQFITTETDLHSQFSRISNFRVEAAVVQGEAQENIAIHHAIAYYDYNKLVKARNDTPERPAIGIAMEDMNTGEVRSFITKGFVTNEIDWDWSALTVGTPLFVGPTGELTPNPPTAISLQQIATVVNQNTVFVEVKQLIHFTAAGNLVPVQLDRDAGILVADDSVEFGGATELDELNDVTITTPDEGEVLVFDAGSNQWTNQPNLLATLGDVNITNLQDGEIIAYDQGSDRWINKPEPTGTTPPSGFFQVWGYVHFQSIASTIWTINHNLGTDKVIVGIIDPTNEQVFPNGITILDVNTIQIDFSAPQAGRAYLTLFV